MEMVARTDKGRVREQNEDSLALFPEQGLALLADGMGGHNAGEVASRLALDTVASELLKLFESSDGVDKDGIDLALQRANVALFDAVKGAPELTGMGTTMVLTLWAGRRLLFAHVGDSRLYRYRDEVLAQLTVDHSMIQELISQGMFVSPQEAEEAGVPSSILTRGLGIDEGHVAADIGETEIREDDLFLLCSDGLSDMVADQAMLSVLESGEMDLPVVADHLLDLALEEGGIDNISLILMRPKFNGS
jgi:protein phosphatase